jgi:hypothetical protein
LTFRGFLVDETLLAISDFAAGAGAGLAENKAQHTQAGDATSTDSAGAA